MVSRPMALSDSYRILIEQEEYQVKTSLFPDDEIHLEMESIISKQKYETKKDAKNILQITTTAKMELDAEQFYDLIHKAFTNQLPNITYSTKLDGDEMVLKITWILNEMVTRDFELILKNSNVPDVERMSKMMADFVKENVSIKKEIATIFDSITQLRNNLVNPRVEIYQDFSTRKYFPNTPVIEFLYDKKHPDSKLHVQATIPVRGCRVIDNLLYWCYGETIVFGHYGYSIGIRGNRDLHCSVVIPNHRQTGNQTLKLYVKNSGNYYPFKEINPMIKEHQTSSIVRVEEI